MLITLSKHADKPATLVCLRKDGSVTWQNYGKQGSFFPIHDLAHYVVETHLGYRNAFLGMVAAGRDLSDFGSGDAKAFHQEAFHAEMLAGILTTTDGNGSNLSFEEIKYAIDRQTRETGLASMKLTERDLSAIRQRITKLAWDWRSLPDGESTTLEFTD